MTVNDRESQIVIVGGGPVGMLLACELAGRGVRTVVLEDRTEVSRRPKATTLHARTVQCLQRRGHLPAHDGLPAATHRASPFHFAGIPGLSISVPATEPEPLLKCPQEDLERLFEERARTAGVRILRGHRVTEIQQSRDAVHVVAQGPSGQTSFTADYLVGADGARSTVRTRAGIPSHSIPATVSAMAGDVRLADEDALSPGWHRTPRGWVIVKNAGGGVVRLRTLNCAGPHPARHLPLTLTEFQAEVAWITDRDIAMAEPRWLSRFSDFSRLAGAYRAGRILLVGDAAHVHFPIGGQGLSTGLLDALNLGWKLALEVQGNAGAGLLDTYDQERLPAARRIIDNARAQLALMRPGAELDPLRDMFAGMLTEGSFGDALASMVSAQDTVLPSLTPSPSPWEGRFLVNAVVDTADGRTDVIDLLRQGRPLLLLTGDDHETYRQQAQPWQHLLHVVRAVATPELPCDALLVRPDGYIAWSPGGDALSGALTIYFGEREGTVLPGSRHGSECGLAEALS
ncbi:FAD-dependent monooxygenase [Streptomyces sp. NPDC047525]|uniref:FAD-dependent monooxygenase n=1 Tax=Streptomyces sp. NPDC047525 TaxID=3155264 RepID=UPI0033C98EC1